MTFRVQNTLPGDTGAYLYEDGKGRFHWAMGPNDTVIGPNLVPEVTAFGGQSDPTRVETIPAHLASGTVTIASGTTKFMLATVPQQISGAPSLTVSTVWTATGSTAAATPTLCRIGLYTFSGSTATLVARTSNDATLWASANTVYSRTFDTTGGFPSTVTLTPGQRIGLAMLFVGTTAPTMSGTVTNPTSVTTVTPVRCWGNITGQTDLATSQTDPAATSSGNIWIGVS